MVCDPASFTVAAKSYGYIGLIDANMIWTRCGLLFWLYVSDQDPAKKEVSQVGKFTVGEAVTPQVIETGPL